MNIKDKLHVLSKMAETLNLLQNASLKTRLEQDLEQVIENTFTSVNEFLDIYIELCTYHENVNPEYPEFQTQRPQRSNVSRPISQQTSNLDEGLAFGTALAVAGVIPAIPVMVCEDNQVEISPELEEQQIDEFHEMMADLDMDY